jgi:hypothetical protein
MNSRDSLDHPVMSLGLLLHVCEIVLLEHVVQSTMLHGSKRKTREWNLHIEGGVLKEVYPFSFWLLILRGRVMHRHDDRPLRHQFLQTPFVSPLSKDARLANGA